MPQVVLKGSFAPGPQQAVTPLRTHSSTGRAHLNKTLHSSKCSTLGGNSWPRRPIACAKPSHIRTPLRNSACDFWLAPRRAVIRALSLHSPRWMFPHATSSCSLCKFHLGPRFFTTTFSRPNASCKALGHNALAHRARASQPRAGPPQTPPRHASVQHAPPALDAFAPVSVHARARPTGRSNTPDFGQAYRIALDLGGHPFHEQEVHHRHHFKGRIIGQPAAHQGAGAPTQCMHTDPQSSTNSSSASKPARRSAWTTASSRSGPRSKPKVSKPLCKHVMARGARKHTHVNPCKDEGATIT